MKKIIYYIIGSCLLLTAGCSNWLEVNPQDRVEQKEMFSSENGFKNALIGTYIELKNSNLYGKALTLEFVENLAQHWTASPESMAAYASNYDYTNSLVEAQIKGTYGAYYNVITNLNNILAFTDNGVLTGEMYNLIKGEALAERAFCHLDLLRLFGPVPGEQNQDKILTYVRTVSKEQHQVNTWDEYVAYLEKDLDDAAALLKDVEETGMNDDFFAYRENRLNYWAVLALKARFYLWVQNKPKAAEYANMVIANKKFRLNKGEDFASKDHVATPEHLFSLHIFNLEDVVSNYFFRNGGVKQDVKKIKTDLFEQDITDFRVAYLWDEIIEKPTARYTLIKYKQEGMANKSLQQIPLIRLYEMYLIAIECTDTESEYKPLIDELVVARNISLGDIENVDKKNEFIAKEYQKEFYGEGMQFFQYKRRGDKEILWTETVGEKDVYVLPLPKSEIKFE